jgi:hypothetical protein
MHFILNTQLSPVFPLVESKCSCHSSVFANDLLAYLAECSKFRLNVTELHAKQVSQSCYLIVQHHFWCLALGVVSYFKHRSDLVVNHNRIVENSSKTLHVRDCL